MGIEKNQERLNLHQIYIREGKELKWEERLSSEISRLTGW